MVVAARSPEAAPLTVYVLTSKGVLHRGEQTDAGLLTNESCNLDATSSRSIYEDRAVAERDAKRLCGRCFAAEWRKL